MSIGFVRKLREWLGSRQKVCVNTVNFTWLFMQVIFNDLSYKKYFTSKILNTIIKISHLNGEREKTIFSSRNSKKRARKIILFRVYYLL